MLDLAVRHDAIPTNPARGTSRVHRPKQETKALRVEDLVEIRAAVRQWVNADRPGPKATGDMADIVELMLATGCRIGEILGFRWSDLDLDSGLPILTVSGTVKTETGKGTYRKATPKSDASRRTVVLPRFATELLRVRREFATPNENDAVFATRNGTWHQVVNIERPWRQIRKDTGYEWVTPHIPQDGGDSDLRGNNVRARLAPARTLAEPSHPGPLHRQATGLSRPLRAPRAAR